MFWEMNYESKNDELVIYIVIYYIQNVLFLILIVKSTIDNHKLIQTAL